MKPENKPLWYDVYEAFPPRTPPQAMRPVTDEPVRTILYPEDQVRAMLSEYFGNNIGTLNLKDDEHESEFEKLVNEYQGIRKERQELSEEEIFIIIRKKMKNEIGSDEVADVVKSKSEFKSSIDISKLW